MNRFAPEAADSRRPVNLHRLAEGLLAEATGDHSRRAARTLPHPVDGLRQTLIALSDGAELKEHDSPGPASLLVLRGTARLNAGEDTLTLVAGDHVAIPPRRHSLTTAGDTVVLLTVARPTGPDLNRSAATRYE